MVEATVPESADAEASSPSPARPLRVGIFYHADPVGHVPGGIETVIRGVLKWAPDDIEYTLYGATSDPVRRPVGRKLEVPLGDKLVRYVPMVSLDPSAARQLVPLTIRYMHALRRYQRSGALHGLDVLDFHRIEALTLFRGDARPKNVMIHQDMEVIRNKDCDIGWRHAPWLYEYIEPRLFRLVSRVFCVRRSAVERYRRIYPDLADRFAFLPTWVDPSFFRPLADEERRRAHRRSVADSVGAPPTSRFIVTVGRLDRQKDPLLLLEAVKRVADVHPDVHLLIVGDGTLRPEVEARIRALGLGAHVTLVGTAPAERIRELLQASDVFALSSAYEGMPIAVLEALASGVPVVTTDVGEVRLVVRDGVSGFVVPERTPEALANGMAEALARLDTMLGAPCVAAVSEYVPDRVLSQVYQHHRGQRPRGAAGRR
ncbi:MAG: glycosyltransferase family 4 protein [Gammaproteobacteria bacterium]|nr:glycosyltransferase family 4 protein [Gammaproteobacteria bacterium]